MRRVVEYGSLLVGLALLLAFGRSYVRFQTFQGRVATPQGVAAAANLVKSEQVQSIGTLRVPRLHFSVSVVEGDDEKSLEVAAGHLPGSALAGGMGNMIVAGHRDSAFWPLRNIRKGDKIEVETGSTGLYRVEETHIVEPSNVASLADTRDSVLTLVTCYPFRHVGPAPQRFIVRAKLIDTN